MIPNRELNVSRSLSIPAEAFVLGAVAFLVIDPLAPNWHIEQYDLGSRRYAFAMKKKRFTTGGDGEAMQVLRRRIQVLARQQGFGSFELVEFSEGIESNVPIAQRVSHSVVQFAPGPGPN